MSATDIKYDYESTHATVTDGNQNCTDIGKLLHAKLYEIALKSCQ